MIGHIRSSATGQRLGSIGVVGEDLSAKTLIYYIESGFIPVGYRKDHFKAGVDEIILDRFLK